MVARSVWGGKVKGSNPLCPTHKIIYEKMNQEIDELQRFTVEEFQTNFDTLIERVENGESFIITDGERNAVIVPYNEVVHVFEESNVDDDVIRIHTDHEEGC